MGTALPKVNNILEIVNSLPLSVACLSSWELWAANFHQWQSSPDLSASPQLSKSKILGSFLNGGKRRDTSWQRPVSHSGEKIHPPTTSLSLSSLVFLWFLPPPPPEAHRPGLGLEKSQAGPRSGPTLTLFSLFSFFLTPAPAESTPGSRGGGGTHICSRMFSGHRV